MLIRMSIGLIVALAIFVIYVSTREGEFRYERSGLIQASPEKIYPYLSQLRLGETWSPYEKMAPGMKKVFHGQDGAVGSKMDFESKEAGSGTIEILKLVPNGRVELRLLMTAPFKADHLITYKLTPEAGGTRFQWAMSGNGGFIGKLMAVVIDCEKMIGDQFSQGIENLKSVIEASPK